MHGCDEDEPYPCCGAKSGHLDWCHLNESTDNVEKLCALITHVGGTMRLYGKPVDAPELRELATVSAANWVEAVLDAGLEREAEEKRWAEVWADVERVTKP